MTKDKTAFKNCPKIFPYVIIEFYKFYIIERQFIIMRKKVYAIMYLKVKEKLKNMHVLLLFEKKDLGNN